MGCHEQFWWWLPIEVVETAVRYYERFPDEIDAWLAEGDRLIDELFLAHDRIAGTTRLQRVLTRAQSPRSFPGPSGVPLMWNETVASIRSQSCT